MSRLEVIPVTWAHNLLFGNVRARGDGGVRRGEGRHDVATRDVRELRSNKYDV